MVSNPVLGLGAPCPYCEALAPYHAHDCPNNPNKYCRYCGSAPPYHGPDCPKNKTVESCPKCSFPAPNHSPHCPHRKTAKRDKKYSDLDKAWAKFMNALKLFSPLRFKNYVSTFANYRPGDIGRLTGLYEVIFDGVSSGMLGHSVNTQALYSVMPQTAAELPKFFRLSPIERLGISAIHQSFGVERAMKEEKKINEMGGKHPFSQMEAITYEELSDTDYAIFHGLQENTGWNSWDGKNRAVDVKLDAGPDKGLSHLITNLQPGQYSSMDVSIKKVERKGNNASTFEIRGLGKPADSGGAFYFDKKSGAVDRIVPIVEGKYLIKEDIINTKYFFRRKKNRVYIMYRKDLQVDMGLNGHMSSTPLLYTTGTEFSLKVVAYGLSAIIGR